MNRLIPEHRRLAQAAADALVKFSWGLTPQGHAHWCKVRKDLLALAVEAKPKELKRETRMIMFGSPGLPEGYQTVVGYLACTRDDRLSANPHDTVRDGFWLTNQCKKWGYDVIKVPSPHIFADYDLDYINSYPVELIRERFHGGRRAKIGRAGPGSGLHRYTKRNPYAR